MLTEPDLPDVSELPDLADDSDVPALLVDEYQSRGHVCVRGLASKEEIAAYGPVIREVAMGLNRERRALKDRDTYGRAFLQMWNLWAVDERVRRFTLSQRFAGVASKLMGVPAVRIYHDQALFKEGGGGSTPWHQDQFYWPFETDHTITMWMPLTDVPAEVGTMSFVSGSHRFGYLGDYEISDGSDAAFSAVIADKGLAVDTHGPIRAGDATFHAGWVLHSAPPNPTLSTREVMTVIYFADGTRAAAPSNTAQEVDLARWLPGVEPGELAASSLNPLVYSNAW